MTSIDAFLNKITMYRLVLYYLSTLLVAALFFSAIGKLSFSPAALLFSTVIITAICWIVNEACAYILDAHPNVESVYITAFILALIISPVAPGAGASAGLFFLVAASVVAIVSKYLLAPYKKHIFNPAAFGVAFVSSVFGGAASWWVAGNIPLLAFVLVGGLLVVRKIQRFDLVIPFVVVATLSTTLTATAVSLHIAYLALVHSSLLFLAFVMLTEPLTTPPLRRMRIVYGIIVGALFSPALHVGSIYATPELALLVGNVFSFAVSPKRRYKLTFLRSEKTSASTQDFIFKPDAPLDFAPGQYMEWTLPHASSDSRGNRRYFTIASSPTERDVRLGVKFYDKPSTFKKALSSLAPGETMSATSLAGDFTLPHDPHKKMIFIAGGIGITPFRSMLQYLIDKKEKRDVILFYANRTVGDIAYGQILERAQSELGIRTYYAVNDDTSGTYHRMVDIDLIVKNVPDYKDRMYFISGPRGMVLAFEKTLSELHIPRTHIRVDFFPGFA